MNNIFEACFTISTSYLLPELPEKRFEVRLGLGVGCTGHLALNPSLHVVLSAVQIFCPNTKKKLEKQQEKRISTIYYQKLK